MYEQRQKSKAPVVRLRENVSKIVHALAYVIKFADENDPRPSQYDLVKTLFLADRSHLNEWGRLITYDNYVAMQHGPVPSFAFDLLKGNTKAIAKIGGGDLPWSSAKEGNYFAYFDAQDLDFEEVLSQSDMDMLEKNYIVVRALGFSQVRKLTHEDAAYVDAWEDHVRKKQFPMSLGMLFDSPNFEKAEEIAEFQ